MKKVLFLLFLCVSLGSAQYGSYPMNYIFQDTTLADAPFPLTTNLRQGAYFADTANINYYLYVAALGQSGTNPPTQQIWVNTFPDTLVWSRFAAGIYTAKMTGIDINTKCYPSVTITSSGLENDYCYWVRFSDGADSLELRTFNGVLTNVSQDNLISQDGPTVIEIRQYK